MANKKITLNKKISGTVYDIYPKTSADIVTYGDTNVAEAISVMNTAIESIPSGKDGRGITNAEIIDGELVLTYSDEESDNLGIVVGTDGQDGKNGIDGINGKDGTSCTHYFDGTVLTLTSASGTSSVDLKGEKGDTGEQGIQGIQGEKGDKGDTGANGKDGIDGHTPVKGIDYYTESEKSEIIAQVLEAINGSSVFGYVDKNNNIIVSGKLDNGSYIVKYEMEDGTTLDIGNLMLNTDTYYSVTSNLTNCTNGNNTIEVVEGNSYTATIIPNTDYNVSSITVIMGGIDITSSAVNGSTVNISSVTGNIVITAVATKNEVAEPTYTNLAKNFETGRLNSSGEVTTSNAAGGVVCTDYIPFTKGTIVRVKGFGALTDYNIAQYNSAKAVSSTGKANGSSNYNTYSYDSASGVVTMEAVHASVSYLRVSGVPTGTTDNIIITVNEEIV